MLRRVSSLSKVVVRVIHSPSFELVFDHLILVISPVGLIGLLHWLKLFEFLDIVDGTAPMASVGIWEHLGLLVFFVGYLVLVHDLEFVGKLVAWGRLLWLNLDFGFKDLSLIWVL